MPFKQAFFIFKALFCVQSVHFITVFVHIFFLPCEIFEGRKWMQFSPLATPFPCASVSLAVKKTDNLFYHMHPKEAAFFCSLTPCVITAFEVLISEHFSLKHMNAALLFPAIPAACAAPLEHH